MIRERNVVEFARVYRNIVMTATCCHDAKENAYHMLMLGMSIYLSGSYDISSNLEAGHGRSDITLKAKQPGGLHLVIEFKQGRNLPTLAKGALEQIKKNEYYTGLSGEVLLMGIAHNKKNCEIETEMITVRG